MICAAACENIFVSLTILIFRVLSLRRRDLVHRSLEPFPCVGLGFNFLGLRFLRRLCHVSTHNTEGGGIGALGRYQMRENALKDAGLMDKQGRWTGKHGVNSIDDFLDSPKAQERAFADFMRAKRDQLERKGAFKEAGRTYTGLKGEPITITESGLLAAGHRMGQGRVKEYLDYMRERGWRSDFGGLDPKEAARHKAVETRLREFQNTPVRRTR